MAPAPLTERTRRLVDEVFADADRTRAAVWLVDECGNDLPFCDEWTPEQLDRLRIAALKLSGGSLDELRDAIELSKVDWRDLLVAAGFGHDTTAHLAWRPG